MGRGSENRMYKIDLHTHSLGSPDGSLRIEEYRRMLSERRLDYIAITDHDSIASALRIRATLGDSTIVGEEVTTTDGELIGLYLTKRVVPGMSALATARAIQAQGGLVYVPHPFEAVRNGLQLASLDKIADWVAIIETYNGRAVFQNCSRAAQAWADAHEVPGAASSDAHGWHGWGRTYTEVAEPPTKESLQRLLKNAAMRTAWPGIRGVFYPKYNRLRKRLGRV